MPIIRYEQPEDRAAIRHVHAHAFGQPQEANLVDALRQAKALLISLVAVQDGRLVGHIAFSPVTIVSETTTVEAIGLGPLAVLPADQRTGIGARLVTAGLTACRETAYGIVVVLGHPDYYPRFGFTPAQPHGIVWEHEAPPETFMVHELHEGVLAHTRGVVKYRHAFDVV